MTTQLGFLEPLEWTREVIDDYSISRLGGLPVISLEISLLTRQTWPIDNCPSAKDLQCAICFHPLRLLMQLYAPTDAEEILRIIYVFLCKDGRCQRPGFSSA